MKRIVYSALLKYPLMFDLPKSNLSSVITLFINFRKICDRHSYALLKYPLMFDLAKSNLSSVITCQKFPALDNVYHYYPLPELVVPNAIRYPVLPNLTNRLFWYRIPNIRYWEKSTKYRKQMP